ncbi:glycosyltransferase family 2 protein [Priestia flexa]|uniref:glycosyltransferase family 2 protein n=1 Tax=Priestia flexa TaxID=86664 RepID=UPI0013CF5129|nr:glycosyltransferase family 2 protein [Priestia flexa]MCG7313333.1 glycosyltransferase family 2 protein [Priestia flexa]
MKKLSIILIVQNDEATIRQVIRSTRCLNPHEVIVLAKQSMDGSVLIAKEEGCIVKIENGEETAHELRMKITRMCKGDAFLYLDSDYMISEKQVKQFVQPLLFSHCDVVLNKWDEAFQHDFGRFEVMWSRVLHDMCNKPHYTNAYLSPPYAFTKEVYSQLSSAACTNPLALFVELQTNSFRTSHHLSITTFGEGKFAPGAFENKRAEYKERYKELLDNYIAKTEAVSKAMNRTDAYQPYENISKGLGKLSSFYKGKQLSVVIPVKNEAKTLQEVIKEVRKLEPLEVIVIVNGSTDESEQIAKNMGAKTIVYKNALGHDVGRTIGAEVAKGDIILFVDGDFSIKAYDLYPFARAIADGLDVALNKSEDEKSLSHSVQAWKFLLNEMNDRGDLWMSSLTAVPHAISKQAINKIGAHILSSPPMAMLKCFQNQLSIASVHDVNVNKQNRFRFHEYLPTNVINSTAELIIKEYMRAFYLS